MFRDHIGHPKTSGTQYTKTVAQFGENSLLLSRIEGMPVFIVFRLKQIITLKKSVLYHKLHSSLDYFLGLAHIGNRSVPVVDIAEFFSWIEKESPSYNATYYERGFKLETDRSIKKPEQESMNLTPLNKEYLGKQSHEYRYILVEFENNQYLLTGLEIIGTVSESLVSHEEHLILQREKLFNMLYVIHDLQDWGDIIALGLNPTIIDEMIRRDIIEDSVSRVEISASNEIQVIDEIVLTDSYSKNVEDFLAQTVFRKVTAKKEVPDLKDSRFIFFKIGTFQFAIKLSNVASLIKKGTLQGNISLSHPFISGMLFINNSSIFIVDSELLISPVPEYSNQNKRRTPEIDGQIVVISSDIKENQIGLIVDEVIKIDHIEENTRQHEVFPFASKTGNSYISSVYWENGEPIFLLNAEALSTYFEERKLPVWCFPLDIPLSPSSFASLEKDISQGKITEAFLTESELYMWFRKGKTEAGIPIKNIVYFWNKPPVSSKSLANRTFETVVFNGRITPIVRFEDILPLEGTSDSSPASESIIIFKAEDLGEQQGEPTYYGIFIDREVSIKRPPPIFPLTNPSISKFAPHLSDVFSVIGIRQNPGIRSQSNHLIGIINENWLQKEILARVERDSGTTKKETVLKQFSSFDPIQNYYFSWLYDPKAETQHMLVFELQDNVLGALEVSEITKYMGTENKLKIAAEHDTEKIRSAKDLLALLKPWIRGKKSSEDIDYVRILMGEEETIVRLPKLLGIETFSKEDFIPRDCLLEESGEEGKGETARVAIIDSNQESLKETQEIIEGIIVPSRKHSSSIDLEGKMVVVFSIGEIFSHQLKEQNKRGD